MNELDKLREQYFKYLDLIKDEGDEYDKLANEVRAKFNDELEKILSKGIIVSLTEYLDIDDIDFDYISEKYLEDPYSDLESLIANDVELSRHELEVTINY